MCNPLAIAAVAVTAAGTYAQYRGQRQAQKAMAGAVEAESIRQKRLRDESQGLFNESLGNQTADAQIERLGDKVAERSAAMTGNQVAEPVANIPVIGGAPDIVADETGVRVNEGNARARDEATAKAALAAFGDLQLGNALMNTRYGQQQSQLSNFMQGSSNVLPIEVQAASHRGDKTKLLGDTLVAIGSIMGMGAGGAASGLSATTGLASLGGTKTSDMPATTQVTSSPNYLYAPAGSRYSNPVVVRTPYQISK